MDKRSASTNSAEAEVVDAAKKPPYPPYLMPFVTWKQHRICSGFSTCLGKKVDSYRSVHERTSLLSRGNLS